MKLSQIPTKFNIPFANGAAAPFIRTIPQNPTGTPGQASLQTGFPQENFNPVAAGGVPPFGQDFNGLLNQSTAWNRWQGTGAFPAYDPTFQTAIGGYPQNSVVGSLVSIGLLWLSIVDDNVINPDNGGAGWVVFTPIAIPSATLYVRTDGNDSNSGQQNTSSGALRTITAAITKATTQYNLSGRQMTVQMGLAGTYDTPTITGASGQIILQGDTSNQDAYILTGSTGLQASSCNLILKGLQLFYASGATQGNLQVGNGGFCSLDHVTFGGVSQSAWSHLFAPSGGNIIIQTSIKIASDAFAAFQADYGGAISFSTGSSCAFSTNNYTFSHATASATNCGTINAALATLTGTTIGARYSAVANGVINTNGGGETFFPGNSAGSTATGGRYV